MNPLFLIQLTENDKRILIALCLVIILVFVLIGFLGLLIIRTMKWQGKKCDTLVSDVVINKIVTTPHQLRKYARIKNIRYFMKQAWLPLLFITIGALLIIIRNIASKDWTYNPFNEKDGFGSLLFLWDFADVGQNNIYTEVFGIKVLAKWPPLYNEPHFVSEAIFAYIAVPLVIVDFVWYLVTAQAYLARTIRGYKLSKQVFEKSLDGFNQNTPIVDTNQEQQQ